MYAIDYNDYGFEKINWINDNLLFIVQDRINIHVVGNLRITPTNIRDAEVWPFLLSWSTNSRAPRFKGG